jgi:hypothetical protein
MRGLRPRRNRPSDAKRGPWVLCPYRAGRHCLSLKIRSAWNDRPIIRVSAIGAGQRSEAHPGVGGPQLTNVPRLGPLNFLGVPVCRPRWLHSFEVFPVRAATRYLGPRRTDGAASGNRD